MKNGYLVTRIDKQDEIYVANRLMQESKRLDIDLTLIDTKKCFICQNDIFYQNRLLGQKDFAIIRYHEGLLKNRFMDICSYVVNSQHKCDIFHNKYNQARYLNPSEHSLYKLPKWLLATCDTDNYDAICSYLGSPFVAKGLLGHGGDEISLISNKQEFDKLSASYKSEDEILFQEFIKESSGNDIRVFVIDGKAISCMKRISLNDFRSNYSLGGNVEKFDIDKTIKTIAYDLYEKSNLQVFGIDLLLGKDGYYLCEINVNPGFEGLEKATGDNIAGKILQNILYKIG